MRKNSICIDFVHKITFWSHFRHNHYYINLSIHKSVRCACTKSYATSEPYPRALQIWCQNMRETRKKKVIKVSRRELCVLQSNCAKCRGGGGLKGLKPPPPSLFKVKLARFGQPLFLGLLTCLPKFDFYLPQAIWQVLL